ncbi:metallophosphoesterase [Variovorax sp. J22G73]|uniref:metallophosphoesterase family protein n=1 Tax=unclassified Variovorax TaxID=663243 RepID=UPI002578BFF7|nr:MULTISPECIES: metallophosphoesterase [unclassified Variovorax]MDM0010541.1 metallophosphoesterase [Variovorax sp. J22R203]MDM0102877.1 metallophosphoesterase [Variovorax sp. J22G73]
MTFRSHFYTSSPAAMGKSSDERRNPEHQGNSPSGYREGLIFCGDPHGEFLSVVETVKRFLPVAIVLLGDLQPRQPLHVELSSILDQTQVWFIHGNHDTDSDQDFDHLFGSKLGDRNLHGRVETIAGYRIAGLGGVFRKKIWDPAHPTSRARFISREALLAHARRGKAGAVDQWRGGYARKHFSSIFPEEVEALSSMQADILVTHEAPSAHPRGFQVLDDLAVALGAKLLVHGHHHEDIDYVRDGLMGASSPFAAFGVDMGSFFAWPPAFNREQETQ